jgi:hypothetical protein
MMDMKNEMVLIAGGVACLLLFGWYASANAQAVGEKTAEIVGDAAAGVAIGVGEWFGIPKTEQSACDKALAEGRTWDASFACPAGTWIKSLWN